MQLAVSPPASLPSQPAADTTTTTPSASTNEALPQLRRTRGRASQLSELASALSSDPFYMLQGAQAQNTEAARQRGKKRSMHEGLEDSAAASPSHPPPAPPPPRAPAPASARKRKRQENNALQPLSKAAPPRKAPRASSQRKTPEPRQEMPPEPAQVEATGRQRLTFRLSPGLAARFPHLQGAEPPSAPSGSCDH